MMIKCPSCGKKVLGDDLLSGVCSNCRHRLSASDSGAASGDVVGTIATEMSHDQVSPPPIDSISGALSGFDQPSSAGGVASSADPASSAIDQTIQSDVFFGESDAASEEASERHSHEAQRPDTNADIGDIEADVRGQRTLASEDFGSAENSATIDSAQISAEDRSDRTYVSDDDSESADPESAFRTIIGDSVDGSDSGLVSSDDDGGGKTLASEEFIAIDDPESSARTLISDSFEPVGLEQGDADKTFVSEEVPEALLRTVESIWGDPESIDNVKPNMTLKAKEAKAVKSPKQTLVIKTKAFSDVQAGSATVDGDEPEYELIKILGEGGMGVVYDARQTSIDRNVAVKMLKPATAGNEKQRAKFLAEAVVTGDLDHPNIVPIYDVGANSKGALFYSMKKVQGTPWLKVIQKKSLQENLDILMRIADAVGFAHARGIVHRDLKPENVMLGEFGEVLVMDWGLAQASRTFRKSRSITETNTMGGTPAYMAPEMATGPIDKITPASDVYLIGAMLYEVITGMPPHVAKNAMKCLMAAARNEIAPTSKTGELVDIALKAMATNPSDRYQDVKAFQAAIRDYQSHSESIVLSTRAEDDLQEARQSDDYQHYSRALFGFQEAHDLWSGNKRALAGISEAQLAYAESARRKGDFDLGLSLLDPQNVDHIGLRKDLIAAQDERTARQKRLVFLKRMAGGLAVAVFMIVSTAAVLIYNSQLEAVAARDEAVKSKEQEVLAKKDALNDRDKARAAEKIAIDAQKEEAIAKAQAEVDRDNAVAAKKTAVEAKEKEELAKADALYEAYISKIGLAASQIDKNAFDAAREVLNSCTDDLKNWEWGRLMYLCSQSERDFTSGAKVPLDTVATSRDGKYFATGGWDAKARIFDRQTGKVVHVLSHGGDYVHSVAFSPDGRYVATGGNDPDSFVQLWDAKTGQRIRSFSGHGDAVVSVAFSNSGSELLTTSYDKTARLWDVQTATEKVVYRGHTWWVWAAAFSRDDKQIVTAGQDSTAIVWDTQSGKRLYPAFRGHQGPVYCVAFSPDGNHVVTGGYDRKILVWNPRDIEPENFQNLVREGNVIPRPKYQILEGHTDAVRSVAFPIETNATLLVSAGQDNTVRLWDFNHRLPLKAFRGHGGSVQSVIFLDEGRSVLSASHDGVARQWNIDGYEELRTLQGRVLSGHQDAVLAAAYSKDQKQIVTASRDRTARTWDVHTGKLGMTFEEGHAYLASSAVFFPDGRRLLTAAVDNTVRGWDVTTGGEVFRLDHTGRSAAIALSADSRWIATGSDQKTAQLWDAKTGKLERTLAGNVAEITAIAFSPDNKLLATGDAKGHAKLWDIATGNVVAKLEGHTRKISAIVFLSDGSKVLTASLDKTVSQWDVASGKELPKFSLRHPDAVLTMKLIPGATNRVITSCSVLKHAVSAETKTPAEVAESHLTVWNVDTAKAELSITPFAGDVFSIDVSSDGSSLISANATDRTVRKWDLATGEENKMPQRDGSLGPLIDLKQAGGLLWSAAFVPGSEDVLTVGGSDARLWNTHAAPIRERLSFRSHHAVASARFSSDGNLIVTGSWDNSAKIWNAKTGHVVRKLIGGHESMVNTAVFSPDGKLVLTASDDGTAKLWSVETGEVVKSIEGQVPGQRIRSASFSSDGRYIATASSDKTARLWDGKTYEFIREFKGHEWTVLCAEFSPNGKLLVTGSDDQQAFIWDVETAQLVHALKGHTASVASVSFSPDGTRVLTGSQDQTAKVWDTAKGKEILTLSHHTEDVTSVVFSPDGRQVLTGSRDGTAVIWLSKDWMAKHPDPVLQVGN